VQAGRRVLVRSKVLVANFQGEYREYKPLVAHPLLFREFAAFSLDTPHESLLEFATRYGHLTAGVAVVDERGHKVEAASADLLRWPNGLEMRSWLGTEIKSPFAVEDDQLWLNHAQQMRNAITEWERAGGEWKSDSDTRFGKVIAANLRNRVFPCFEDSGALSYQPVNLLAALWLQLAWAVGGGHIHKQCPQCQQWFRVAGRGGNGRRVRPDKRYCSDPCRMQAAYARRASHA
jgi:hypothetical protein